MIKLPLLLALVFSASAPVTAIEPIYPPSGKIQLAQEIEKINRNFDELSKRIDNEGCKCSERHYGYLYPTPQAADRGDRPHPHSGLDRGGAQLPCHGHGGCHGGHHGCHSHHHCCPHLGLYPYPYPLYPPMGGLWLGVSL